MQANLLLALTGWSAGFSIDTQINHHPLWPMVVLLQKVCKEHEKQHHFAVSRGQGPEQEVSRTMQWYEWYEGDEILA